jgi:carboxymethylenebutenolidase
VTTGSPTPYFLARPDGDPPWPGVVVIMEGNGMSPWLLRICQRLAGEGYAAIAPDVFHHFGGSDPDKLPDQFMNLRSKDALDDVRQCAAELRRMGAPKVGITGFCMGGRITYEAATKADDVDAAAGFYGAQIGSMLAEPRCPLHLFFGGTDDYIPADEIAAVEQFHHGHVTVYPQAGHGFMRDGSDAYDEAAASDAWPRLLAFFGEHLR